jgi:hypothetical protein
MFLLNVAHFPAIHFTNANQYMTHSAKPISIYETDCLNMAKILVNLKHEAITQRQKNNYCAESLPVFANSTFKTQWDVQF